MTPPRPSTPSPSAPDAALAARWLAACPAALAQVDSGGSVAWSNAAAAAWLGADPAGAQVATALGLDAAERERLAGLASAGGSLELPWRRDGSIAGWLQVDARPLDEGGCLLALASIDALVAAREQAARANEFLDLAREFGRLGSWERDVRTGRGRWDRHVFRIRGLEGEGEAPSIEQTLAWTVPEDRDDFARVFGESMRAPGVYRHRYRVRTPGGELRALQSQWVVKAGPDGTPARAVGLVFDDTEALALARAHDELVSQFALAVDLAGLVIWRHDLGTGCIRFNAEGYKLLQIEPQPEDIPLADFRLWIHPDDLPLVDASARSALASGRPVDLELRFGRGDAEWRTLMTRRVLQRDTTGKPAAFIGVALDVSDRIDESRRALELARRFELVTRTAGIGYWSLDGRADRARWSEQLREIHGLPAGEPVPSLAEWLSRFVHRDDGVEVQRRFSEWVRSGRGALETDMRIVRGDGEVRHLMTHSRVEGRERQTVLFGVVVDVTERRRAEIALRAASERAALATRGAGLGTWELDLAAGSARWDEQMWRLRGLEPRPDAPDDAGRLALLHPDDRERVRQRAGLALAGDAPINDEFRVVWPDGQVRWLASRSVLVRDEHGQAQRRIGVNWDITDSRTADAVRQEREIALRESQAKSKFLARMSHELRTPLNGVLGFAQLLLAEDDGRDPQAQARRRRIELIHAAGEHLLSLINDVLDLSSLEGGELRIALQPVALAPLVAATIPLLETPRREMGVEFDCAALDGVALADATRLRQVLLNLLSNAVKYNRPGGSVRIEAAREGAQVVVLVSDTGRGMSADQLAHLFEPFNRLGIEAEGIEGTGIGLAIVKAAVERMGGSIRAESRPGEGTRFELRLAAAPALAPAPPDAAPDEPAPTRAAGGRPRATLLYIEDNPVNAQIIEELIGLRGDLELHVAPDGASGVRRARELRPDLVLLDMQLPDFDGHEVLRRLRADPATASVPVVALSANAMPEDIERALRAGVADYWTKPLDFGAFLKSIDAMFGTPEPG